MGGDSPTAPVGQSTAQQLQAYIQYLPGLMSATAGAALPTGQTLQDANKVLSPQQNQLQTDMFKQYGPQLSAIGDTINANTAKSNLASNTDLMGSQNATDLLARTNAAQRQLDPEYYAARSAAGSQLGNLLGSIDLSGLSGSERAEVERSNNQQDNSRGILNTPSQTATTQNAMQFGNALNVKRQALGSALGTATNFLNSSQGPVNALQTVTGASSGQPNAGTGQFQNPNAASTPGASSTQNMGSGLLSGINATQNNIAGINSNLRDSLDRTTGVLGSLPSIS